MEPSRVPLRVVVADDHADVLAALVALVEDDPRFSVVGTAADGPGAVRLAEVQGAHLVLLDVNMPGGGIEAARALAAVPGGPCVVAISADPSPRLIEEMLAAGAAGYLTKGHLGAGLPDLLLACTEGEVIVVAPPTMGSGSVR